VLTNTAICSIREPTFAVVKRCGSNLRCGAMDMDADEMRRRANRYRHIASTITDARAIKALNDLADEYEAQATQGRPNAEAENEDNAKRRP
jgi:hypothetical protein